MSRPGDIDDFDMRKSIFKWSFNDDKNKSKMQKRREMLLKIAIQCP